MVPLFANRILAKRTFYRERIERARWVNTRGEWLAWGGGNRRCSDGRRSYLLCSALVSTLVLVVDAAEVGHNDWHRQGNDQDTTE